MTETWSIFELVEAAAERSALPSVTILLETKRGLTRDEQVLLVCGKYPRDLRDEAMCWMYLSMRSRCRLMSKVQTRLFNSLSTLTWLVP